jgi:hypothetical protein
MSWLNIIFLDEELRQLFPMSQLIIIFLGESRQVFPISRLIIIFWKNYVKIFLCHVDCYFSGRITSTISYVSRLNIIFF